MEVQTDDVHAAEQAGGLGARTRRSGCLRAGRRPCEGAKRQRDRRERPYEDPGHPHTIVVYRLSLRGYGRASSNYAGTEMSPTWIWMQIAIVVFVLIGMVVAITKLA
jgi:hypothetical protein